MSLSDMRLTIVKHIIFYAILIGPIFNIKAQTKKDCTILNHENIKISEITSSKRSQTIDSHGLPNVSEDQFQKLLHQASTVCVIQELDALASDSYEKIIQRSPVNKKLYLVYIGGISGNDKHVFGPLIKE